MLKYSHSLKEDIGMKKWAKQKYVQARAWVVTQWRRFRAWLVGLLVSLGLIVGVATAGDVNLSWTNAVQWEDGTPMAVGDIQETIIYRQIFALDGAGMADPRTYVEKARVPATVTTYVDSNQANGIHCYVARHLATNGELSQFSNESCKTIDIRLPGRPTGLSAN